MRGTEKIHLDNVASENCSIIFKKKKKKLFAGQSLVNQKI